jgi:hypothetical protein
VFLEEGGSVTVDLSEMTGKYNVVSMDIKTGERKNLKEIAGERKSLIDTGMKSDMAILILYSGR